MISQQRLLVLNLEKITNLGLNLLLVNKHCQTLTKFIFFSYLKEFLLTELKQVYTKYALTIRFTNIL